MKNRLKMVFTFVALAGLLLAGAASTGGATVSGSSAPAGAPIAGKAGPSLVYRGSVDLSALAAQARKAAPTVESPVAKSAAGRANRGAAPAIPVPNPPNTPIAAGTGGASGFVALTVAGQGAVNNSVTVEPPDQGLCAHSGVMIEAVNLAIQVYTEGGAVLTSPVSLNAFFGLPPLIDRTTNISGPFLSDPKCYYDGQTGRWFITILEIDVNPYTGKFGYRSSELIAVSATSDPTGKFGLFSIDSTDDGVNNTPSLANCPCFGDQPRIGADANGFYISTDIYPIHGLFNSNGGEIWAMSKKGLAKAAAGKGPVPTVVALYNGATTIQGEPANAVQPAVTPEGGTYAPNKEYFLSTPDFNGFATSGGVGAQAVVLWTLSGTNTLNSPTPSLTLTNSLLPSEPYATPINAAQKPGPTPYADSIGATLAPLSVNDDRMQQVEYASGLLYSAVNTAVGPGAGDRSGIAWFVVNPHGAGQVVDNGYVAVGGGASLMYPAIGLTPTSEGVMTFSISGPSRYPSHAYIRFSGSTTTGPVFVDGPGVGPEDGFTCYSQSGFGPACRWGDYSAATADGSGNIVMATEMIPNTARRIRGNWGTYISTVPAVPPAG
ncbi:MAG: hypothetical protein M3N98_11480 [Actinomycetota bacterium]|nr:hypothetical protein [Actinomycetota bacterium]